MTVTMPAHLVTADETVVQRLVLPVADDGARLPLYVETDSVPNPDMVLGRMRMTVPATQRVSFGTYFNAFPASYWRRWTEATEVTLRVQVTGTATVTLYRSNSRGNQQRVTSRRTGVWSEEIEFSLTLTTFADGGWYWFDITGGHEDAVLERAEWIVPSAVEKPSRVTIGITTFNRPDSCVDLLRSLVDDPASLSHVDRVVVVDQGTQLVEDQNGFTDVLARSETPIEIVRQPNLGGSGGFARGMFEATYRGESSHVLLLDDDVVVEPEGILRGLAFADLARTRVIVGGHMLNMHIPSMLHSFGEKVNRYRFMWGPAPHVQEAHDFATTALRETPWLHRRIDVDYNGWWMCLIPTSVVREIGLAMPVFIKWDDAEFGLRAAAHGVPTVTLPGVAVWHVPWTDKDDTIDWQAYHHARNRILVALLHSPYPNGGSLIGESVLVQLKHALSMQYSTAELRLWAIEDLLSGPEHLHRTLPDKLGQIRKFRAKQDDAAIVKDPYGFPQARRAKPPSRGKEPTEPGGPLARAVVAAKGVARQVRPVRPSSLDNPEIVVPAIDLRWWLLGQFDSAVVSTADGTGASWYKRDPARFKDIMARSARLHEELYRRWDELRVLYRDSVTDVAGPDAWSKTWGIDGGD